jgi:hypothetical protein
VNGENLADDILIDRGSEGEADLVGNLGPSPGRISPFFISMTADQVSRRAFWGRVLLAAFAKATSNTFVESSMKAQQRGWLERDRDFPEPTRFDPERTESGN